jgi:hypothetical protein
MKFLCTIIYFAFPNFTQIGLFGKAINYVLAKTLKILFDLFVPTYLRKTASKAGYDLNTVNRDGTYIVSLTSFPARINDIWITIGTI